MQWLARGRKLLPYILSARLCHSRSVGAAAPWPSSICALNMATCLCQSRVSMTVSMLQEAQSSSTAIPHACCKQILHQASSYVAQGQFQRTTTSCCCGDLCHIELEGCREDGKVLLHVSAAATMSEDRVRPTHVLMIELYSIRTLQFALSA